MRIFPGTFLFSSSSKVCFNGASPLREMNATLIMNLLHLESSLSRNACMVFPGAFEIKSGFDEEISMKMYWENVPFL